MDRRRTDITCAVGVLLLVAAAAVVALAIIRLIEAW
jgi:hypothetical protein